MVSVLAGTNSSSATRDISNEYYILPNENGFPNKNYFLLVYKIKMSYLLTKDS